MFTIRSFSRAILHVDGDCFFASCEIAKNPTLKGKVVITGKERGIVSSLSYEAKALGISRAMKLSEVRKICPQAIILPSDYETYSIYSQRMYTIVRRYTPAVEEYGIDECFADLTGMRATHHMSYEDIAFRIQRELDTELGMTFSIGLSVNKVLAKVASKWRKPHGLTVIPGNNIHQYIDKIAAGKIWGIGHNTASHLYKYGIRTAMDFASADPVWVSEHLSKPFQEIHAELRGGFVYPLILGEKHDYASISKTRTFTPPSMDKELIYSQLSKNVENACIKLRRHNLYTRRCAFFLKTQEFQYSGSEIVLSASVCAPQEILRVLRSEFDTVYKKNIPYRATGIVLMDLSHDGVQTMDMFGSYSRIARVHKIVSAIDDISRKYGKHSVFLGSSFKAMNAPAHRGDRSELSERRFRLLKGENARRRIGIPFLGKVT